MSKHTLGLCRYSKDTDSRGNPGYRIDSDEFSLIAWLGFATAEQRDAEEYKARLFAAAPELLEALDNCITNINATAIAQNDVSYMIRRLKAINEIARAAIAKASGE